MRRTHRTIRPVLAAVVLARTYRQARTGGVSRSEARAFHAANNLPSALCAPIWAVMQSGSLAAVFVAAGAQARQHGSQRAAVVLLVGVGVWGGVKVIKPMVGRGRPAVEVDGVVVRGLEQTGLGFPSGHAAVAATLAIALCHDFSPAVKAGALAVAATTGGARMYVGAHLPLDIVGGLAIGTLGGGLATLAIDQLGGRR